MKKVMIKLGGLKHLGELRWIDALDIFDEIYCISSFKEYIWDIPDKRIKKCIVSRTFINRCIFWGLDHTKKYRVCNLISKILIKMFRMCNVEWLKSLRNINSEFVLCSYGDYDYSDIMLVLTEGYLNGIIVRAIKETRPEYNYLEQLALKKSDIISLYCNELQKFIEKKYGKNIWDNKRIKIGIDENYLSSAVINKINYKPKLSSKDKLIHIVLMTYRADSMPLRDRDKYRYYYIELIKELISYGYVVHMHCKQFINNGGINQYKILEKEYKGAFIIEEPLEMRRDASLQEWIKSCEFLSRYDVGILHNIMPDNNVSVFDRINIPHRYFAYEAAHVIPIIKRGENIVLERIFETQGRGFVFDNYQDIEKIRCKNYVFETVSYKDYLLELRDISINYRNTLGKGTI